MFVAFNMYLETHLRRQSLFFIAERSVLTANKILKLGLYKPPTVEPCYVSSAPRPFNRSQFWKSPQSNTNVKEYSIVFNILKVLYTSNIRATLFGGSVLGARRHMGIIPFGEWDVDIAVFSTDTDAIEKLLNAEKIKWSYNEYGFGYHINNGTNYYTDLWLLQSFENGDAICVGIKKLGGCKLWYSHFGRGNSLRMAKPAIYNSWVGPDVLYPFGPYLLPIPYDSTGYLNLEYGIHWNVSCSEYDALVPCKKYYGRTPFVFVESASKHVLRVGKEVKQVFDCPDKK